MQLLEMLKHWAALQPDRCQYSDEAIDLAILREGEKVARWQTIHSPKIADSTTGGSGRFFGYGDLQRAIQQATVAYGMLPCIEHDGWEWKATLWDPAVDNRTFESTDSEPAIALLSAYLQWLEQREGSPCQS